MARSWPSRSRVTERSSRDFTTFNSRTALSGGSMGWIGGPDVQRPTLQRLRPLDCLATAKSWRGGFRGGNDTAALCRRLDADGTLICRLTRERDRTVWFIRWPSRTTGVVLGGEFTWCRGLDKTAFPVDVQRRGGHHHRFRLGANLFVATMRMKKSSSAAVSRRSTPSRAAISPGWWEADRARSGPVHAGQL
jgi:hypothetical protein